MLQRPGSGHRSAGWLRRVANVRVCSQNGHLQIVEALLARDHVAPTWNHSAGLRIAASHGHLHILERLLPLANPAAFDNSAIRSASQYGHLAIVERLLADPRVEAFSGNNYAAYAAFEFDHAPVLHYLLSDVRAWRRHSSAGTDADAAAETSLPDSDIAVPTWLAKAAASLVAGGSWPPLQLCRDVLGMPAHGIAARRLRFAGLTEAAFAQRAWGRRRAAVRARATGPVRRSARPAPAPSTTLPA